MLFDIIEYNRSLFTCFYRATRFIYGTAGKLRWKDIAFHTNLQMGVDLYNLDDDKQVRMIPLLAKKYYLAKFKDTKYDPVIHIEKKLNN